MGEKKSFTPQLEAVVNTWQRHYHLAPDLDYQSERKSRMVMGIDELGNTVWYPIYAITRLFDISKMPHILGKAYKLLDNANVSRSFKTANKEKKATRGHTVFDSGFRSKKEGGNKFPSTAAELEEVRQENELLRILYQNGINFFQLRMLLEDRSPHSQTNLERYTVHRSKDAYQFIRPKGAHPEESFKKADAFMFTNTRREMDRQARKWKAFERKNKY